MLDRLQLIVLTKIHSATNFGLESVEIEIETNVIEKGFPGFTIVGLSGKSETEVKERVRTALVNSNFEYPNCKITTNLAPADLPKEGSVFDLAIAMGVLSASGQVKMPEEKSYFFGELSLDGSLRHSKGVFLLALLAKENGVKYLFVPRLAANEAAIIKDITVYPVSNLEELANHLNGEKEIQPLNTIELENLTKDYEAEYNFGEIIGQDQAKRALEIAAAGGHNILLIGPPGSGKTMLARALAGILPDLDEKESIEVTKIFSITGNIPAGGSLVRIRPFRSPHHTTSQIGLIGGGSVPHPGEVTLAHRGVLFCDEFPEYSRTSLEALRQPIEDGKVTISRANGRITFPSQFMLVAAANPCPCGYWGDPKHECKCTQLQIINYQKKLSGPIMDRIDMHVIVPTIDIKEMAANDESKLTEDQSKKLREKVTKCRQIQSKRFSKSSISCNAEMKNKHIKELIKMEPKATLLLRQAAELYRLSTRTYFRLIKLSQTIADLDESGIIKDCHVAEALEYRIREQKYEKR